MTRRELIDTSLINGCGLKDIQEMLKWRDELRCFAEEEKDLEEFAQNTKNFIIMTLTTPFGEHPVFVDRACAKEAMEYIKDNSAYQGLGLK